MLCVKCLIMFTSILLWSEICRFLWSWLYRDPCFICHEVFATFVALDYKGSVLAVFSPCCPQRTISCRSRLCLGNRCRSSTCTCRIMRVRKCRCIRVSACTLRSRTDAFYPECLLCLKPTSKGFPFGVVTGHVASSNFGCLLWLPSNLLPSSWSCIVQSLVACLTTVQF